MSQSNPLSGKAFRGPDGYKCAYKCGTFLAAAIFSTGKAVEDCARLGIRLKLAEEPLAPGFIRIKAQGETVNSVGGYLLADELEEEILSLRESAGVFRANARVLAMGSDSRAWPRRVSGPPATLLPEGGTMTESNASWDSIRFNAKKLYTFTKISSELYEDERVGLAQWFAEEAAFAFATTEDGWGFIGDGTSTYGGVRGLTSLLVGNDAAGNPMKGRYVAAAGHNTFALLDTSDIAGLIGTLPEYALPGAAWYASNIGAVNTFYRLAANASGAIGTRNGEPTYLGFPIRSTPKLPAVTTSLTGKVMLLFGDLSLAAAVGNRRGLTVSTSDQRYLDSDQIAVRCTERVDVVVHDVGDGTKAGPIVAMVAP